MKKIKEFVKRHKTEIVLGGIAVSAIVYGVVTRKKLKLEVAKFAGKSWIKWTPTNGGFITTERAKEILELNRGAENLLALVKGGEDVYELIRLNGSDIIV